MKPLLAHTFEPKRWTEGYAHVQPKFDGIRALYQAGCFQSRDELPITILKHLTDPLREMFPDDRVILDGELYVHGWPLGRINGAATPVRQVPTLDTILLEYYVFDRVMYDRPFEDRFATVLPTIKNLGAAVGVYPATTVRYDDPKRVDAFYAMCVNEGYEGIMYRLGACPYTVPKQHSGVGKRYLSDKDNRTWHLLKRKDFRDDEFICVDFNLTTGEKGEEGFQLFCVTKDDRRFKVGSGLTTEERRFYHDNSPVGRLVKVKFRCYTADGIPFNPTVITIL